MCYSADIDCDHMVGVIRTFSDGEPLPDDGSVTRLKKQLNDRLPNGNVISLS